MTADLLSPSDGEPSAVQRIRALYQQRELGGGERLTTSVVAGEVGVSQTLAGAALRLVRTIEAADPQREAPQIDAYASKPSSTWWGRRLDPTASPGCTEPVKSPTASTCSLPRSPRRPA